MNRTMILTVAILTTGCTTAAKRAIAHYVPPATDQFARTFIDSLQHASPQAVRTFLASELAAKDAIVDTIALVQRIVPTGRPDSLEIVNFNFVHGSDGITRRTIYYQMHAGGQWALIALVVDQEANAPPRVTGFRVWTLRASLQTLNALTLGHASTGGLIAAPLAILVLAVELFAAVQVVRSPLKRRWLWVIVALIGFGKVGVQWNSGNVNQQWIAVTLFGTGIVREGLYGAWWIFLSMPGGAIVALDRRRRAIAGQAEAGAALEAVAIPVRPTEAGADGSGG